LTAITFKPAFTALFESIDTNCPHPASLILLANFVLASPLIFNFSTATTSYLSSNADKTMTQVIEELIDTLPNIKNGDSTPSEKQATSTLCSVNPQD
jgi:hypothetical protein